MECEAFIKRPSATEAKTFQATRQKREPSQLRYDAEREKITPNLHCNRHANVCHNLLSPLADVVAIIGTLDVVFGEIDR